MHPAVGFHLGPVGTCFIGTDDPAPPAVIERRDDHVVSETKSVGRNGTRYWPMSPTTPYEKSPVWGLSSHNNSPETSARRDSLTLRTLPRIQMWEP
jgi:hypothetical protein